MNFKEEIERLQIKAKIITTGRFMQSRFDRINEKLDEFNIEKIAAALAPVTGPVKEKVQPVCGVVVLKSKQSLESAALICRERLSRVNRKTVIAAGVGVMTVCVVAGAVTVMAKTNVYQITAAGEFLGYVETAEILEGIVTEVKSDLSQATGFEDILVDEESIEVEATKLRKRDVAFLTEDEIKDALKNSDLVAGNGYVIEIGGSAVATLANETDAEAVMSGVIAAYQSPGSEIISAAYKEEVEITQQRVQFNQVMGVEDSVSLILTGTKEPKTYTVVQGDTLWDIAMANGMSPYELETANPGFDPAKIQIGQVLNLYEVKPYVTVVTTERLAAAENIEYDILYEETSSLFKGQQQIKIAGVYGVQETVYEVVKENGIEVASTVVGTELVSVPETQVMLTGTKPLSAFVGSGSFVNPVPLNVSSAYGSRGGGRHTGVDLRNPKGTTIVAADGGVVTFASYSGSYGNIVKLSHGNGIETWYAHCDSITVSVGDLVEKGQKIATVGITGRATGYHLHFEVRKDGEPQNPMNYL